MSARLVESLESRIGARLPDDYRGYLITHADRPLGKAILFSPPRTGVVDEILTAEDLLKNDEQDRIGIPDRFLLHIGGNLLGGYLYLDLSKDNFGKVHYMENYVFRETFPSFSALLGEPRSDDEE